MFVPARSNPFASHRIENLAYRAAQFTWDDLLERLWRHDRRGAIVGAHGSGKTTILDGLTPHLKSAGSRVHRITVRANDRRSLTRIRAELEGRDLASTIVLFDGAEQLSSAAWLWLRLRCRRAGGLITTSHRQGRLATLYECATSPELLAELVAELAPDRAAELADSLPGLWAVHGGDLRGCLRDLYDRLSR